MPRLERERAAKLALLEALAASQRAVARMLESMADLNASCPGGRPEDVTAMLARLAGLQLSMCEALLGVKLRRMSRGRPAEPWLAADHLRAGSGQGGRTAGGGCFSERMHEKKIAAESRSPVDGREAE
jgi:Zn-dependent protease with chaperone function